VVGWLLTSSVKAGISLTNPATMFSLVETIEREGGCSVIQRRIRFNACALHSSAVLSHVLYIFSVKWRKRKASGGLVPQRRRTLSGRQPTTADLFATTNTSPYWDADKISIVERLHISFRASPQDRIPVCTSPYRLPLPWIHAPRMPRVPALGT